MADLAVSVLAVAAGYLLGTFPTAQLVGRRQGFDPTASGSGNPGATNVTRVGGWRAGATVLLGDAGKGAAAAGLGLGVGAAVDGLDPGLLAWCTGAAAVAGHVWPATRRFRGGKGVATGAGVTVVCAPLVAAVAVAVFGVLVKTTRTAAVGSLAIALLVPVGLALTGRPATQVAVAALMCVAVIARHAGNLRRMAGGSEPEVRAGPRG